MLRPLAWVGRAAELLGARGSDWLEAAPRDEGSEIRATHPETKKCAGQSSGGGSQYHVRSAGIPTEIDLQCCEGGRMKGSPSQAPAAQHQAGLQCGRLERKSEEGIAFLSLVGRQRNPVSVSRYRPSTRGDQPRGVSRPDSARGVVSCPRIVEEQPCLVKGWSWPPFRS